MKKLFCYLFIVFGMVVIESKELHQGTIRINRICIDGYEYVLIDKLGVRPQLIQSYGRIGAGPVVPKKCRK